MESNRKHSMQLGHFITSTSYIMLSICDIPHFPIYSTHTYKRTLYTNIIHIHDSIEVCSKEKPEEKPKEKSYRNHCILLIAFRI